MGRVSKCLGVLFGEDEDKQRNTGSNKSTTGKVIAMKTWQVVLGAAAVTAVTATGASANTIEDIRARGELVCGVAEQLPGFAFQNDDGIYSGLDVDTCRAVAAAVLGDASKVKFVPLTAKVRFTALQSGEVDMLSRNTTWTFSRDNNLGFEFTGINYYDGQGFMVPKALGVTSALELDGASVCTNTGTTTELNAADFFRTNNLQYTVVAFEKADEVVAAYDAGRCDVYTTDQSGLAAQRIKFKDPDAHVVLPEVISKEPLGPLVRHGDNQWGDVVRWTLNALISAEELGVTQANAQSMATSSNNPEVKRLLGTEGDLGAMLGLQPDWAQNVIVAVGNYGEIFDRTVGPDTPLKLERGLNALWKDGGILYSPPFR